MLGFYLLAIVPLQQETFIPDGTDVLLITGVKWSDVSVVRELVHWDSVYRQRKKVAQVKKRNNQTRKKKEKGEHQRKPNDLKIC